MMIRFYHDRAIIFNTVQAYRKDRFKYLQNMHKAASTNSIIYGVKLVRLAYMEKERKRAESNNYPSPIHENKAATDKCFNNCLTYIIENINHFELCNGIHNEESSYLLLGLIKDHGLQRNDSRIYSAQLLGMSDHISFNLAEEGYNVAKYVPFGPVREMMPYLIRIAQENSSAQGQTNRELKLISYELKQRKRQAREGERQAILKESGAEKQLQGSLLFDHLLKTFAIQCDHRFILTN